MIHAALPTPFAPRLRGGRLRACRRAVLSPKWGRKNGTSTSSGQTGKGLISMGEMIRMTMDDGAEIAVCHAQTAGDRRGGLVLIQETFGVTDHIKTGRAAVRERVRHYVSMSVSAVQLHSTIDHNNRQQD